VLRWPTLLYNSPLQHFSTTLLHNTSLHHFSTTLLPNIFLQHFSTTLFWNTSLQHSSQTAFPKTLHQHFSTTPLYNTLLEHFSTTLFSNSLPQDSPPTLLHNTSLQHSSPTLLSNALPQHFSTSLFSNALRQHSPPTLLFSNYLQHFSTTFFSNNSLQQFFTRLLHNTPSQHFPTTLLHNISPQHLSTTVLLCTTKYYSSTTPVLRRTTKHYSSTTRYYKVLLQSTATKYYSDRNDVRTTSIQVLLRITKYYSSTSPYTTKALLQYYSVLQSTTPVLLRTTKWYKSFQNEHFVRGFLNFSLYNLLPKRAFRARLLQLFKEEASKVLRLPRKTRKWPLTLRVCSVKTSISCETSFKFNTFNLKIDNFVRVFFIKLFLQSSKSMTFAKLPPLFKTLTKCCALGDICKLVTFAHPCHCDSWKQTTTRRRDAKTRRTQVQPQTPTINGDPSLRIREKKVVTGALFEWLFVESQLLGSNCHNWTPPSTTGSADSLCSQPKNKSQGLQGQKIRKHVRNSRLSSATATIPFQPLFSTQNSKHTPRMRYAIKIRKNWTPFTTARLRPPFQPLAESKFTATTPCKAKRVEGLLSKLKSWTASITATFKIGHFPQLRAPFQPLAKSKFTAKTPCGFCCLVGFDLLKVVGKDLNQHLPNGGLVS